MIVPRASTLLDRVLAIGCALVLVGADSHGQTVPTITLPTRVVRVVRVRFQPVTACLGVDDTINPVAAMAPVGGVKSVHATIAPASQITRVQFLSVDTGIATVSPNTARVSPEVIQVGGVGRGETAIRAFTATSGALRTLTGSVKTRINKTVAIHAISEENDDVQVIPVGQGDPNQACIAAGPNGVFNTVPAGDDSVIGTTEIGTGSNGICESTASGDDVQMVSVGNGSPNKVSITQGSNSFRDSIPAGDDQVVGNDINTGADGISQTGARSTTSLVPTRVPSAAALRTHLNAVWGLQANVFFTVTRTDATLNYDLDRNDQLADPFLVSATDAEINVLSGAATAGADYDIYFVQAYEVPAALALPPRNEAWIGDTHSGTSEYVAAHEMGHLLGRSGHSTNILDLMVSPAQPTSPCEVRRFDWNQVNP